MTDQDDETGGHDPSAFARRRAQATAADVPALKVLREPEEPHVFTTWLSAQDAQVEADWQEFLAALGPKPKQTAGPMGPKRKAELAQWWLDWSEGRLQMDKELSAIFSHFPPELASHPAARYHGELRAARRRTLVEQSEQKVKERAEALRKAQAELYEAEAPKRAGRAVALAAVQAGFANLDAAIKKEQARQAKAKAKIENLPHKDVAQAQANEAERAAANEAALAAKLSALETLEASIQPVSPESIQQ